jgi:type IV secretory pathway VirB2 component (pilin)
MKGVTASRVLSVSVIAGLALIVITGAAHAAGSGMPWESPLEKILDSLTGPVAKVVGAASFVVAGAAFAFSEGGSALRRTLGGVLGLSIALNAVNLLDILFGFTAGALLQ